MKKFIIFFAVSIIIICIISYIFINYKANYNVAKISNLEFENYLNKELYGTDVSTLINRAVDNNEKNSVQKNNKGIYLNNDKNSINIEIGMKDDDGSVFGGAFGFAAAIPGMIGSGAASARASRLADETRESLGEKNAFGRDINSKSFFNRGKHLLAGIAGGAVGGYTGYNAALDAKNHKFNSALEAISRGNDGSTLLGRMSSSANNMFRGEGRADSVERSINSNKGRIDALKAIKSRVSSEMVKSDWTSGSLGLNDSSGRDIKLNFKRFEAELAAARSNGATTMTVTDVNGVTHDISLADAERQRGFLLKNNEDDYISQHVAGTVATSKVDQRLITLIHNAEVLGGSSDFTRDSNGNITKGNDKHITNRSSINDAIDGFEDYNTQLTRQNAINKANDKFSGKK